MSYKEWYVLSETIHIAVLFGNIRIDVCEDKIILFITNYCNEHQPLLFFYFKELMENCVDNGPWLNLENKFFTFFSNATIKYNVLKVSPIHYIIEGNYHDSKSSHFCDRILIDFQYENNEIKDLHFELCDTFFHQNTSKMKFHNPKYLELESISELKKELEEVKETLNNVVGALNKLTEVVEYLPEGTRYQEAKNHFYETLMVGGHIE